MTFSKRNILTALIAILCTHTLTAYEADTIVYSNMSINSAQDDYLPFMLDSALMFTSNRNSKLEGASLQNTEKVYFSVLKKNEAQEYEWTPAQNNGYKWNSDNNTALVGVSNLYLYFYRAYWLNNGEIYRASRIEDAEKPWKATKIKKVKEVCTDSYDECAIADVNGSIYFVSNKSGNYDIYLLENGKAVPVDILNSEADENDLFFSDNTLFFASDRSGGYGGYDIYYATLAGNRFEQPQLLTDTIVNTPANDRDYRKYADTLAFFASDRDGGKGGLDIYQIKKTTITYEDPDTIPIAEIMPIETFANDTLMKLLDENGLLPFRGEVQLGAFRYITSLTDFKRKFPCVADENIRMDMIEVDGIKVYKFIIDTVYNDVESALLKRDEVVAKHCLPEELLSDKPFVGVLDKNGNRFAFFREKREFDNDQIYYLYKNGQLIWYGRRF